jgi:hypothetical protein
MPERNEITENLFWSIVIATELIERRSITL